VCYGGGCYNELRRGECWKQSGDICPEKFDTPEDYEAYLDDHVRPKPGCIYNIWRTEIGEP